MLTLEATRIKAFVVAVIVGIGNIQSNDRWYIVRAVKIKVYISTNLTLLFLVFSLVLLIKPLDFRQNSIEKVRYPWKYNK